MGSETTTVGIDLGTTTCEIAYMDHTGRPATLVNFEGQLMTPSALLIEGQQVVVGDEAKRAATSHPTGFVECFKRNMGDDLYPEKVDGRTFRPEVLSAMMLHRLKKDASRQLGDVRRAIVTVPAYFDERRRRATQDAGSIADLEVVDIINEPTAAAICYAHRTDQLGKTGDKELERILVYDLGGGTFDTTILEIARGKEYRTVATDGEVRLGGYDWDQRLRDFLAEQFQQKTGCNPLELPQGKVEFMRMAQQTKHSLSLRPKVSSPCSFEGHRTVLEVTRDAFEQLTADLLERTRDTTHKLVEEAGFNWQQVDKVLLVGGSTRMPMVGQMMEKMTGKPPERGLSADESVAHGAAIYAGLLASNDGAKVINVNSHSLRILGKDLSGKRVADLLIKKNTPLPARKGRVYPAAKAGQTAVSIRILEGESDDPELCEQIGTVRIEDLPADPAQQYRFAVSLKYRADGRVEVDASVRDGQNVSVEIKKVSATLEPNRGLTHHELRKAQRELGEFEIV